MFTREVMLLVLLSACKDPLATEQNVHGFAQVTALRGAAGERGPTGRGNYTDTTFIRASDGALTLVVPETCGNGQSLGSASGVAACISESGVVTSVVAEQGVTRRLHGRRIGLWRACHRNWKRF